MAKRKTPDPLIEALEDGRSYTITLADGGDLASMRAALKHGQTLTYSPVTDYDQIQVNDIVIVKWHGGGYINHLVGDKQDEQFLIVNSLGTENGWTHGSNILGRVTERIDPEPRPTVPEMLAQMVAAYESIIMKAQLSVVNADRLLSIASDMQWYADLIGAEAWQQLPSLNQWSFEQHLWHLLKEAKRVDEQSTADSLHRLIHHGKEHIGYIAIAMPT